MANWNNTKLTCNDLQKFIEIMKTNPFTWPHTSEAYEDKPVEIDKDGEVFMQSRWILPIIEIKKMSKENPDLVFTAEYSLEEDFYTTSHICTYKNGEETDEILRVNYGICLLESDHKNNESYKIVMGDHYVKLYDRVIEIFRRLDIECNDQLRGKYIDFVYDVTLKVEDDEYQMEVSKGPYGIEKMNCLRKQKMTETKLVPIRYDENDLPFPFANKLKEEAPISN
jgi:hypothetical protein